MKEQDKIIHLINTPLKSYFLEINDYKIHYTVSGTGNPLILIHGLNIGWGQWYSNIGELSKHFTVYTIDMPGAGLSSKLPDHKINLERTFVKTMEGFINSLNLKRINILGHSLGGWIILKLALRERISIDKVILVSPMGLTDYVPWRYKLLSIYMFANFLSSVVVRKNREKDMHNFLTSVLYEKNNVKREFLDYFFAAIQSHNVHPFMLIHRLAGFFKVKKELVLIDQLSKITQPVLIIMGANDPIVRVMDIHKTHKLIPQAKLEIFLNSGHLPFIENSKDFNRLVINFLK